MFALGRLIVIGFVVLSIIYVALSFYSRSVRRRKLNEEWVEEGMTGDQDSWVEQGLKDYDGSLRRKLLLGVYVVPTLVVVVIIYLTNFA
ncbi:MAG: hypothetical protein MK160_05145 [Rhodobacteraceae bacterium]|nr:hypothetical protein [Paracoccaceae bacterium]